MALDQLDIPPLRRASLNEACAEYEQHLNEAADYLVSRGFTEASARHYRLGVVRNPVGEHARFEGMLAIPYLSNAGVLGFKFRCPLSHDCKATHGPKYDSPAGQRARLYNVNALQVATSVVAIVEGEMCAAIFESQVGVPTVGTPGTQWEKEHPHWPRVFADVERKLVVADHDLLDGKTDPGKGVGHAKRVVASLPGAELILPPPGLDPDEWIAAVGVEKVREALGV